MINIKEQSGYFYIGQPGMDAVGKLAEAYRSAQPFPHIVIDNFLPGPFIDRIIANFPSKEMAAVSHQSSTQYLKRGYRPQQLGANPCAYYISLLNTAPVLNFLETLTGIEGLIPDPYYEGGGLHETERSGRLEVHADFTLHKKTGLARRINMIVFLNKDWLPEYGGELELWDTEMKAKQVSISPVYNRCVIFNTTHNSYHGQPEPVNCPPGMSRRSVALYYYTTADNMQGLTTGTSWKGVADAPVKTKIIRKINTLLGNK